MGEVGELVVRMVVSLSIVLGLVTVAYGVARRRQRRSGRSAFRRRARAQAPTLDVEARAGLARGATAVAVRFADRIVLIGVSDGAASTVLAEIPASEWDRVPEPPAASGTGGSDVDDADASDGPGDSDDTTPSNPLLLGPGQRPVRTPFDPNGVVSERPSFLEALRDVTSRRP